MKTQYWILGVLVLMSSSCIETSSKFKKLLAERDSLLTQQKTIEHAYHEVFTILNQVEEGFEQIRKAQGRVVVNVKTKLKDKDLSQRQYIASEMSEIEALMKANRSKIKALQNQLNHALANNPAIQSTVDRLQKEIKDNQMIIDSMRIIIEKRDFTISDMNRIVHSLNQSISDMEKNLANAKSNEQFLNQELNELNQVYYCVLPYKELKAEGIIKGGGLFSKPKLSSDPLGEQPSRYKKTDLRKLTSIPLGTSKYTLMTPHPKGSYNISEDENGTRCIFILQSRLFWSKSKVLVVSLD